MKNDLTLEVLVSTMYQKNISIVKKMNIETDCIVVNQCNTHTVEEYEVDSNTIKFINDENRGLSKSRNMAIENSSADICMLADDDVIYVDNYKEIILESFKKNKEYDLICFCLNGIDQEFKSYSSKARKIGYLSSMKISSVEIAFRRKSIIENNIKFDELFGTGSDNYKMGEENIFLYECLRKGLRIKYEPIHIADIFIGNSTWFNGYNEKYFIDKGAAFTAMSKLMALALIFQFAIRKRKLYKDKVKFITSIKYMLKGRKDYLRRCN